MKQIEDFLLEELTKATLKKYEAEIAYIEAKREQEAIRAAYLALNRKNDGELSGYDIINKINESTKKTGELGIKLL